MEYDDDQSDVDDQSDDDDWDDNPIDLICSNFAAGTSMRWNRNCRELDSLNENRFVVEKKLDSLKFNG